MSGSTPRLLGVTTITGGATVAGANQLANTGSSAVLSVAIGVMLVMAVWGAQILSKER